MTINRYSPAPVIERPHVGQATLEWNQTRVEWVMAIVIALTAGYLDGYGLLFLKTYVSFMSGNTTSTGLKIGMHDFAAALPTAAAILSFLIGGFFGGLFAQSKLRHSHRIMFGMIAAAIGGVAVLEWNGLHNTCSQIALMCLAMGMTNPALSKIGRESVSVTFVTGTLTRIGGHLASAARRQTLKDPQGPRDSHLARALIEASIWSVFFAGAVLSGVAGSHSRTWGLLPPCAVVLLLGLFRESAAARAENRV